MDILPTLLAALGFSLPRLPVRLAPLCDLDHAPLQRRGRARGRLRHLRPQRDLPEARNNWEGVLPVPPPLSPAVWRFTCGTWSNLLYNENYEQHIQ